MYTYEYVKEQLLKSKQEGKVIADFAFPEKDMILLNMHVFGPEKSFITLSVMICDRFIDKDVFISQWDFHVAVQPKGEKVVLIDVGNKEWADFVDVLKGMGDVINKAFEHRLELICPEEEREACDSCKNFNKEAFAKLKENMNQYWFKEEVGAL